VQCRDRNPVVPQVVTDQVFFSNLHCRLRAPWSAALPPTRCLMPDACEDLLQIKFWEAERKRIRHQEAVALTSFEKDEAFTLVPCA